MAHDAKGARAIVESPQHRGRRERARDETLVTIDVWCEEQRKLSRVRELAGEKVLEHRRKAMVPVPGEDRTVVTVSQRKMDVAGVALTLVVLRHERETAPFLGGDLLGPQFEKPVLVALVDQRAVLERNLVLAEVALTLHRLDHHARAAH